MARISSPVAIKLVNASETMRKPPTDAETAFMARHFVQATLPHRDPGPVPVWRRQNGRLTMTVYPHVDASNRPRYPYGSIPRLLLFWMVTEAVRTKSRRLELGATLADFMRQIGLTPDTGGGKRGDARRLRDQMERLFRAQITFDESGYRASDPTSWANMPITDGGQVWWSDISTTQRALFGSFVILGEAFFSAIIVRPVPVDQRALRLLRRSPMALDLYAWATHRVFNMRGDSAFIPWTCLNRQVGAGYADPKNFQKAAAQALRKVAAVYPALRYRLELGGVRLLASAPAVPSRDCGKSASIHGETVRSTKLRPRAASRTYP